MTTEVICEYVCQCAAQPAATDIEQLRAEMRLRFARVEIAQLKAQRASISTAPELGRLLKESAGWQTTSLLSTLLPGTQHAHVSDIRRFLDALQLTASDDWIVVCSRRELALRQEAETAALARLTDTSAHAVH